MTSAQISEPPSAAKAALIERFLRASGIQRQIDSGDFLHKYALGASPMLARSKVPTSTILQALKVAYEPYRQTWQEEYEDHLNWEFTEAELGEIVAFLENAVGQHFLEARWRMDAYISTNTERLVEEIIVATVTALTP